MCFLDQVPTSEQGNETVKRTKENEAADTISKKQDKGEDHYKVRKRDLSTSVKQGLARRCVRTGLPIKIHTDRCGGVKVLKPKYGSSRNALLPGKADKLSEGIPEEAEHPRAEDSVAPGQRQRGTTGYQPMATENDTGTESDPLPDQPPAGLHVVIPSSTPAKWKDSFKMVIHLANEENAQRVTCLDTGADVNVISINVVNSLGLAKERYNGPALKSIGDTYKPQWQVTFDWHVAKRKKTYTSTFAVLDEDHSGDFDILLGKATVGKYEFYVVNTNVWFSTTKGEVRSSAMIEDAEIALSSIEVARQDTD